MRKQQQPAQSGGAEYFRLVAEAERCVRIALDREQLPPANREPVMDWLHRMAESCEE